MKKAAALSIPNERRVALKTTRYARLVAIDDSRRPTVEIEGVQTGARWLGHVAEFILAGAQTLPLLVLVTYVDGDDVPIIAGTVETTWQPRKSTTAGNQVKIDGQTTTITAEKQIELRCGDASITLTKDGKVVIKGARVVSRASRLNKIRGSSVQIN